MSVDEARGAPGVATVVGVVVVGVVAAPKCCSRCSEWPPDSLCTRGRDTLSTTARAPATLLKRVSVAEACGAAGAATVVGVVLACCCFQLSSSLTTRTTMANDAA